MNNFKFDRDAIRKVLDGQVSKIVSAFVWEETPQGLNYWQDVFVSDVLPPEGRAYLEVLLAGETSTEPSTPSKPSTPTKSGRRRRGKVTRKYTTRPEGAATRRGYPDRAGRDRTIERLVVEEGYTELGRGSRSAALVHPLLPDVIVRVGVYDVRSPKDDGCDPVDGWLHYFETVVSKSRSKHAPKVHSVTLYDDHYVVEMERLEALSYDEWDDYKIRRANRYCSTIASLNRFVRRVADTVRPIPFSWGGGGLDWHDTNVMVRPGTGDIVVTDPIYAYA